MRRHFEGHVQNLHSDGEVCENLVETSLVIRHALPLGRASDKLDRVGARATVARPNERGHGRDRVQFADAGVEERELLVDLDVWAQRRLGRRAARATRQLMVSESPQERAMATCRLTTQRGVMTVS